MRAYKYQLACAGHCISFSKHCGLSFSSATFYTQVKYILVLPPKWLWFGAMTRLYHFIIPHVNYPYKTSLEERLIFYNITGSFRDGEYCHVFVIAAGDTLKYLGGHMMRNADAGMVRSHQDTFNSNGGHDAWFGDFKLQIISLFMVRNIKCRYSFS